MEFRELHTCRRVSTGNVANTVDLEKSVENQSQNDSAIKFRVRYDTRVKKKEIGSNQVEIDDNSRSTWSNEKKKKKKTPKITIHSLLGGKFQDSKRQKKNCRKCQ